MIKSRMMRWAGNIARMGAECIWEFGGKPKGKRPLGEPTRRREDNIKMDLREIGWVAWTGLIWLRIRSSGGLL
jgi:hypothetical protein